MPAHNYLKIVAYVNDSDELDMNKHLTQKFVLDKIVWKENTSVLEPIFTFHKFKKNGGNVWKDFNYVKVIWGGAMTDRYYFVKDLILQPGGMVEVHCKEDVRYTWRSYVLSQRFLIARNEFIRNRTVYDERKKLPLARSIKTQVVGTVGDGGDGSLILTVTGGTL